MLIFSAFRRFLEAIQTLTSALQELGRIQRELGPALDRLDALERTRHQFEAECEGMLLKADGKLKAASNAEARERQIKKANDRLPDPFPDEIEDGTQPTPVLPHHVAPSETEGVQAVRMALAPNDKAHATRRKFGLT